MSSVWFLAGATMGFCLFFAASRPSLRPIQPHISGSLPKGKVARVWSWPLTSI